MYLISFDWMEKCRLHLHKARCTCNEWSDSPHRVRGLQEGFETMLPGSSFVLINVRKTFSNWWPHDTWRERKCFGWQNQDPHALTPLLISVGLEQWATSKEVTLIAINTMSCILIQNEYLEKYTNSCGPVILVSSKFSVNQWCDETSGKMNLVFGCMSRSRGFGKEEVIVAHCQTVPVSSSQLWAQTGTRPDEEHGRRQSLGIRVLEKT